MQHTRHSHSRAEVCKTACEVAVFGVNGVLQLFGKVCVDFAYYVVRFLTFKTCKDALHSYVLLLVYHNADALVVAYEHCARLCLLGEVGADVAFFHKFLLFGFGHRIEVEPCKAVVHILQCTAYKFHNLFGVIVRHLVGEGDTFKVSRQANPCAEDYISLKSGVIVPLSHCPFPPRFSLSYL